MPKGKKKQQVRTGKLIDHRTRQVLKQFTNGIQKERQPAFMIPDGMTNNLMDLVYQGGVVGDVEIGEDGFIEIMFIVKGFGFFKLKRLPDENQVHLMIV